MKKISIVLLSILLLSSLLVSCGNETTDNNMFNVAIVADFQSISPGADTTALSKSVLSNMTSSLYKYNTKTKLHEPSMAQTITVNDNIVTISLKDGLYFHNENAVTPEDIIYSIKRNAGLVPEFTSYDKGLKDLVNENSFNIVDNKTIEVTLNKDLQNANTIISIYNTIIVPADYSEVEQQKAPISAGPYKFVSYSPGQEIVFSKFLKSFQPPVEIENVTFKIISDTSSQLFAFQNDEIDYISLLPQDIESLKTAGYEAEITTGLANDTNTLFFNHNTAPFNDPEVLKALKYGINKEELIKTATKEIGVGQASVISPYQEKYYNTNLNMNEFNPTLARNILQAKGYSETNRLNISLKVVAENRVTVDMANLVKSYLTDCYVDVSVYEVPWSTYFQEVYLDKNYDATILQLAGYDNPYKTLLFFKTGEVGNLSGYSNPEYDKILAELENTTDEAKKAELFKNAQQTLFFDTPSIFLGDEGRIVGLNKKYTGAEFYPYWFIDISKIKVVQ